MKPSDCISNENSGSTKTRTTHLENALMNNEVWPEEEEAQKFQITEEEPDTTGDV